MPGAVNQALKTLAETPATGADSAPSSTPVSTPEPNPSSSFGAIPEQDRSQPPAEPPVDSSSHTASNTEAAAVEGQALKIAAREPNANGTAPTAGQDDQVERTDCPTCGGYHSSSSGGAFHASIGCTDGSCIPGRQPCSPSSTDCNTVLGAFCANMYQELCCPDPCYQPKWVPAANASFFADYARPRTVTRLRYDNLENMLRPDRNQFWMQAVTPMNAGGITNKPNMRTVRNPTARLQEVYLYQEVAGQRGSFFVETPYRQLNSNYQPTQAGFSDINFGIKSMFYDTELLQLSFQFRTYTPSGNAMAGLGTGHFSLDPSILGSLKLGPDTYFQAQVGNWIPLGGSIADGVNYSGGILYWLMSINQVLWSPRQDSPLIGTLEMDGWSFENGGYTNAVLGKTPEIFMKGGGVSYFNIGPGIRQSICNKVDIGAALTWATTAEHWAEPWFRFEVRFLF
jgi:hypothetical protein